MKNQQEVQRCPNCMAWCIRNKTFNWVCSECGTVIPRKMNSVVEPHLEKRGSVQDAWSKILRA